jgi:hypothetical protein
MSGRYDKIGRLGFRQEVANACGAGFDVPATLDSIEPIEPKIEAPAKQKVAVNA